MSTGSSITDIHVAHSEPTVSAMMRRINAMMERGIASIKRRNALEEEARLALRETQRQAEKQMHREEAKVVEIEEPAEKSNWTIAQRVVECGRAGMTVHQAVEVVGSTYKYVASVYRQHGIQAPKAEFKSEEMRKMLSAGSTPEEVMKVVGCSEKYVNQIRNSMGLTNSRKTPAYTHAQAAKARELFAQGLSVSQIGLAMDRSPNRIRVYLRLKARKS